MIPKRLVPVQVLWRRTMEGAAGCFSPGQLDVLVGSFIALCLGFDFLERHHVMTARLDESIEPTLKIARENPVLSLNELLRIKNQTRFPWNPTGLPVGGCVLAAARTGCWTSCLS